MPVPVLGELRAGFRAGRREAENRGKLTATSLLALRPMRAWFDHGMAKQVRILKLSDTQEESDLEYWLGRPAEVRISAVEILRRQFYGSATRLQRSARVLPSPRA